jgi:hypothetical protein
MLIDFQDILRHENKIGCWHLNIEFLLPGRVAY